MPERGDGEVGNELRESKDPHGPPESGRVHGNVHRRLFGHCVDAVRIHMCTGTGVDSAWVCIGR